MGGTAVLENVRKYRAIASLYRQTASFRPPLRLSLLEQAKEWERLALAELEILLLELSRLEISMRAIGPPRSWRMLRESKSCLKKWFLTAGL